MTKPVLIFFCAVTLLSSCYNADNLQIKKATSVYPINSLVDAQVTFLTYQNAKVQKTSKVGETIEKLNLEMDSIKWRTLFTSLDIIAISKPSVVDAYEKTLIPDSSSNLSILQYSLKENSSSQNLKTLSIYYLKSIDKIKKITAVSNSQGFIYNSRNEMVLEFGEHKGQAAINNFNISTTQKTLLKDSVSWTINTEVVY